MPSPQQAGRTRFSFKSSHRRVSMKISHRTAEERPIHSPQGPERERYIAPPKRRR